MCFLPNISSFMEYANRWISLYMMPEHTWWKISQYKRSWKYFKSYQGKTVKERKVYKFQPTQKLWKTWIDDESDNSENTVLPYQKKISRKVKNIEKGNTFYTNQPPLCNQPLPKEFAHPSQDHIYKRKKYIRQPVKAGWHEDYYLQILFKEKCQQKSKPVSYYLGCFLPWRFLKEGKKKW